MCAYYNENAGYNIIKYQSRIVKTVTNFHEDLNNTYLNLNASVSIGGQMDHQSCTLLP